MPKKGRSLWLWMGFLVLLVGCGLSVSMYKQVEENAYRGSYDVAIAAIERNKQEYGARNEVLYDLEVGLLKHYGRRYEESNRHFFNAERKVEELYTKSISTEAGAMLTNDNLLPYEGEDFEKVFVNLFLALNFAQMGDCEAALVEARKVDVKLGQYTRMYEGKNSYKEDAFIRYVMGALYEAEGEINDAFISYQKAYEAYRDFERLFGTALPSFLKDDLIRTAAILRFTDEQERYEREFQRTYSTVQTDKGSLLVVVHSGKGPIKEEYKIEVSIPDTGGAVHSFKVALPVFKAREQHIRSYTLRIGEDPATRNIASEIGEDVTRIAKKALEERITLIYLKAGGRALMKFLASEKLKKEFKEKQADKKANLGFSALVDAVYSASERADTRTWRLLPDKIHLARVHLPPGQYAMSLVSHDGRSMANENIQIAKGRVVFKVYADVN